MDSDLLLIDYLTVMTTHVHLKYDTRSAELQYRLPDCCVNEACMLRLPGLTSQRHSALISSDPEYFQVCFSAVHYLKISEQR